ncbi:hypothetical protein EC991_004989 [Linnemannia zychae]|nr:hypothetical protein EC991_004989 [Linnemannia zychae]
MKLTTAVSLLLFAPSLALAAPGHLAGITWSFQKYPHEGLDDATFPINMAKSPHTSGFYYAQQFGIKGIESPSYTGLQPRPNDAKGNSIVHGVFSTFQSGSNSSHPNCKNGADGGPGVSCAVEVIGDYAHTYNLEVKRVQGTTWRGTLIDSVTNTRSVIGEWTLPQKAGKLGGAYTGFLEYYPWNSRKPNSGCANHTGFSTAKIDGGHSIRVGF